MATAPAAAAEFVVGVGMSQATRVELELDERSIEVRQVDSEMRRQVGEEVIGFWGFILPLMDAAPAPAPAPARRYTVPQ